ncbi:MAG: GNAT family N-acetyltransferase [Bacteroidia bacterium]
MLQIIRVSPDDREVLNTIVTQLIDDVVERADWGHLDKMLADDRTYLFAALWDAKPIGYALAYRFPSLYEPAYMAYLYDIGVEEEYRRLGAGRGLMDHLRQALKADGVTELWLGTGTDNVEGQALFSATGGIRSDETFNDFTYFL